jgi:hypothetical protein
LIRTNRLILIRTNRLILIRTNRLILIRTNSYDKFICFFLFSVSTVCWSIVRKSV